MLFNPKTSKLSPLAQYIMDENIAALALEFDNGLDINASFEICEYIGEPPIILALDQSKNKVIDWLITKNVKLDLKDNPAFVKAASSSSKSILELLLKHGANINAKDHVGNSAMSALLYSKRYHLIPFLIEHGYKIFDDGVSLRQAVSSRQYPAIQQFLALGMDVNLHHKDMVFPYNSTPVAEAAHNNDFETVKLLVQHGADVTIKNKYGERPYNYAVEHNNEEMISFIKSLEPPQWHNEEQKIVDLKAYKLPTELLDFLRGENRKIETLENDVIKFIVFNSLLNAKEVIWQKHKFLDLLSEVDNYEAGGYLVWYPKKKCLASADYEHGEFKELGSWEEFLDNPSAFIQMIFE